MSILSLFNKVGAAYKNDRSKTLAAHVLLIGGIMTMTMKIVYFDTV